MSTEIRALDVVFVPNAHKRSNPHAHSNQMAVSLVVWYGFFCCCCWVICVLPSLPFCCYSIHIFTLGHFLCDFSSHFLAISFFHIRFLLFLVFFLFTFGLCYIQCLSLLRLKWFAKYLNGITRKSDRFESSHFKNVVFIDVFLWKLYNPNKNNSKYLFIDLNWMPIDTTSTN